MQKIIYLILITFFLSLNILYSQNNFGEEFFNDSINSSLIDKTSDKSKVHFGLDAGTSFMTSGNNNLFNSYISPYVSYPLTSKFSIEVGMSLSRGNFINVYNPYYRDVYSMGGMNLLQTSLFARGKYELSKNITIYGATSVSQSSFLNPILTKEEMNGNNLPGSMNSKSFSMGFEYRFNNGSAIYFEVQHGNGLDLGRGNFVGQPIFSGNNQMFRQ